MQFRNTEARFGAVAQLFHWTIVALIITQFTLAQIFDGMKLGKEKIDLIVRHKEIGMTILMLAVLRLVWRLMNPAPVLPSTLKPYEKMLARATHFLLYFLIFAIPLSGWIMSSAANIPVSYFGVFNFPDLTGADKSLVKTTKTIHEILTISLLVVASLHVLAALKHYFILKDDVLLRMLPRFRKN